MNAHSLIHLFPSLLRSKRLPGLCWYLNPKMFWMESGMTWPPCSQAVLQVWGWCRTCPGPKKRKIEIDAFRGTTENSSHSRACYFYQHIDFTYWLYVFSRARLTPSPHIPQPKKKITTTTTTTKTLWRCSKNSKQKRAWLLRQAAYYRLSDLAAL